MELNAFASLARLQLPSQSRLLASACCPDKDLVIIISRLGGKDRMSLWKMQGAKKWEVDVGTEATSAEEIVGLAWSPDGQNIAVAHDPPRITLHSIQDGQEERALLVSVPSNVSRRTFCITGIWWFQEERVVKSNSIPDIFKRNNIITGSAHSILKTLPLLDHLQEDSQKLTATDLFAFQGSHTRSAPKSSQPETIRTWPSLLPDHLSASISSPLQDGLNGKSSETKDVVNDANMNSILAISDDLGHVHCFLDGSYPLGAIQLIPETSTSSLFKDPKQAVFFAHPRKSTKDAVAAALWPVTFEIPLLKTRKPRDLAKLSSTTRELVWYVTRVVKEMRAVWFGSEAFSGARELGPKWIRALEARQKEQFGQEEPNGMLDLTSLLVTGRVSESLADFLGSGEQMSERGIQKWESTVTDALTRLRDFSEKRVAPACQRLLLVLHEVLGWAKLPQFALFELAEDGIKACLDLAGRAIVISGWLAAVARRELSRFKEFISFIRHEAIVVNPATETRPVPEYDMLEVNHYLMSGLVVSSIDKWFMGPIPQFLPEDLGVPGDNQDLQSVVKKARAIASDPAKMAWQANITQKDLSHLDRNLDALVQELGTRCQRVFARAASASARSALVKHARGPEAAQEAEARPASQYSSGPIICERIIEDKNDPGKFLQYLAIHVASGPRAFLCLFRIRYGSDVSGTVPVVDAALLECKIPDSSIDNGDNYVDLNLFNAEFFDDETIILLYKTRGDDDGSTFIAMFSYNDLGYQNLPLGGYVSGPSREDMAQRVLELWNEGHVGCVMIPIKSCRELIDGKEGDVSLAVNGRTGRRVACVLDNKESTVEILDMEGNSSGEISEAEDVGP